MAKLKKGILGAPSGKLGDKMIASSWLGTPYLKSNPGKRKPPNEVEKQNHQRFGRDTWDFINPLKEFFQISFKEVTRGNRGMFTARTYFMNHVLKKDAEGNSVVQAENMLMSMGSLNPPKEAGVELLPERKLQFSWNPRVEDRKSSTNDHIIMVAYNIEAGKAVKEIGPALRKDGTAILDLTSLPEGSVHLYLGFLSFDRSKASNSIYMGSIDL